MGFAPVFEYPKVNLQKYEDNLEFENFEKVSH